MIKALEALGYLNAKFDLEKQYPDQYESVRKGLLKLDSFINWRKTSGISGKQRSFAEQIAKDLKIDDFDITKFDRKSITAWLDDHVKMWKALKEDQEEKKVEDDPPF